MVPIEEAMHGNDSGQTKSPKLPQEPSAAQAAKVSPTNSPILNSSSSSSSGEISGGKWLVTIIDFFNDHFAWVPNNWHWSKLKPVIRCAVTAWISLVLFVIPAFERALGQVSNLRFILFSDLDVGRRPAFSFSLVGCPVHCAKSQLLIVTNQLLFCRLRVTHSCQCLNVKH